MTRFARLFIFSSLLFLFTLPAFAETSVMVEFGIGFGSAPVPPSSSKYFDDWCQPPHEMGQLKVLMLRVRHNNAEVHGATWWHDVEGCDLDASVIGAGYVFDTFDYGEHAYASFTPGVAWMWRDERYSTNQNGFLPFGRIAMGFNAGMSGVEVGTSQYGFGKTFTRFATVGIRGGAIDSKPEPQPQGSITLTTCDTCEQLGGNTTTITDTTNSGAAATDTTNDPTTTDTTTTDPTPTTDPTTTDPTTTDTTPTEPTPLIYPDTVSDPTLSDPAYDTSPYTYVYDPNDPYCSTCYNTDTGQTNTVTDQTVVQDNTTTQNYQP